MYLNRTGSTLSERSLSPYLLQPFLGEVEQINSNQTLLRRLLYITL